MGLGEDIQEAIETNSVSVSSRRVDEKREARLRRQKMGNNYERAATFSIEEIYPRIPMGVWGDVVEEQNVPRKRIKLRGGCSVRVVSLRLATFKRDEGLCQICKKVRGSFFALERTLDGRKYLPYHLNLYAKDKEGHEVLMTKDHIHPKSLGGRNTLENMQTACRPCNGKKADKVEE